MHHGPGSARTYMRVFLDAYAPLSDRTVVIAPPAAALEAVAGAAEGREDIVIAAQNIYWEEKGAYTGEMSAEIAREAGARMTLVGHSERRRKFGETDADTAKKCAAAIRASLVPMLCVGETDDERRMGRTSDVVARQLRAGVVELSPDVIASMMIAYEPVWAIGTGRNATPEDAGLMHSFIRALLNEITTGRGDQIPILYGGSVSRSNCADLLAAQDVDGLLVGGASLDPAGWAEISRS
jgi:triosephosphate isomerase (TIM)